MNQGGNNKYVVFGALAIGLFASVVDHGSVIVALPSVAEDLVIELPSVQWVVIGYALTISALLLPMGRLSDIVGLKKIYLLGSAIFALFALVAGLATDLGILIGARIAQGAGAAMTQGTGMAIVAASFPGNERGKAMGLTMAVVSTGAIVGPALGGFLVDLFGWRSVFFVNIPLMALGIGLGLAVLSDRREGEGSPGGPGGRGKLGFDWWGATLSTGALLLFLLTITNAHRYGWGSPLIVGGLALFVALLVVFIWWELRSPSPMLNPRFFRRLIFSLGVSAGFLTFLGGSAIFFLTPFYLQRVLGYSPTQAGLVVVPGAVCMLFLGPLSGRLSDRYGWRPFTVGGLALSAISLFIFSRLTETSSLTLVIPALILQSCGMGLFYSPNVSSVLSSVERESYGVVSAFLNLVRNSGNVTSVAVATAIVTATMGSMGYEPSLEAVQTGATAGVGHAFTVGLRYTYLGMTGLLLLAMVISAVRGGRPSP